MLLLLRFLYRMLMLASVFAAIFATPAADAAAADCVAAATFCWYYADIALRHDA